MSDSERAELQSHYPYMGLNLNELSVQEERLILYHLKGMTKAAAGRAAGYLNMEHVYDIFKKPKIIQAVITYVKKVGANLTLIGEPPPQCISKPTENPLTLRKKKILLTHYVNSMDSLPQKPPPK